MMPVDMIILHLYYINPVLKVMQFPFAFKVSKDEVANVNEVITLE